MNKKLPGRSTLADFLSQMEHANLAPNHPGFSSGANKIRHLMFSILDNNQQVITFIGMARYFLSSDLPVFKCQIRHALELVYIMSDDDHVMRQGNGCNQQIIRANQFSLLFKRITELPVYFRSWIIERQRLKRSAKCLYKHNVLIASAFVCAVIQLRFHY